MKSRKTKRPRPGKATKSPARNAAKVTGKKRTASGQSTRKTTPAQSLAPGEEGQRFRALIGATSDVVYCMSADWSEMRLLAGRDFLADTLTPSRSWLETYIHPADRETVLAEVQRALAAKGIFELEHRVLRIDGSPGWIHSRAVPILDERGEIVEWFGAAADVTARRDAEVRLRESEERMRAILSTAVDAILTIDEKGIIQSVNAATERMFGFSESEMIGKNVSMLMPSPYKEEHDGYLSRHNRTGERRIIGIGREVAARRKDGSVFPIDLAVSEVVPRKLFTGIIRDISDRKLAASRLREADRLASIGTLAAGLGHDMNNVLLPVRARLNALRASGDAGAIGKGDGRHVEEIQKSIGYLQQLADGLHFLALDPEIEEDPKGGTTGVGWTAGPRAVGGTTDLNVWWAQTGALLSKAVPKHARVTASFAPSLPRIAVAAHGLTQAVLNLIVNAGESIPPPVERKRRQGYVRLSAELRRDPAGVWVRITVADNGLGMSDEVKRRAFEMFFTTKPRGLGTGLGLALVRKVVERAGGRVEIESAVGKGTSVTMVVPAVMTQGGAADRPGAAVTISDARAAGLVRHLLESLGLGVVPGEPNAKTRVWVVDPTLISPQRAEAWLKTSAGGRVVLFGTPAADSEPTWQRLPLDIIKSPDEFEAVRAALVKACSVRQAAD